MRTKRIKAIDRVTKNARIDNHTQKLFNQFLRWKTRETKVLIDYYQHETDLN